MKLLRETIRRIIKENQMNYSLLFDMIFSGDNTRVRQALELAEDLGLLKINNVDSFEENWKWGEAFFVKALDLTFKDALLDLADETDGYSNVGYGVKTENMRIYFKR